MEENKIQFDVQLGGEEKLPGDMQIIDFASARAQEIVALTEAIEDPQRTSLVFQKLPNLMRRRVMSHNAKRMPRRLREAHIRQMEKSGLPPKSKRPSRKHRRRPQNLLLEYNRRQRKYIWLETHIWHAKRFHMIEKWGYKLAHFPNDKSFRACYRASANHCLLQDISYYCCIEIVGTQIKLLEGFKFSTSTNCGLTFAAKTSLAGRREGRVTLFRKGQYPYGAIGSVNFIWKAEDSKGTSQQEKRTLWIWIHPSIYTEVLNEIVCVFSLCEVEKKLCVVGESGEILGSNVVEPESEPPVPKKQKLEPKPKNIEEIKLATRNVFSEVPEYCDSDGHVCMSLLKDTLNRFRLSGPLSQAVLSHSLNITNTSKSVQEKKSDEKSDDIEEIFCSLKKSTVKRATMSTEGTSGSCEVVTVKSNSDDDSMDVIVLDSNGTEKMCVECGDHDTVDKSNSWWMNYYEQKCNREAWQAQKSFWRTLKKVASPAELSPHQVLGLTIIDPRYQMPSKRIKVIPDLTEFTDEHCTELLMDPGPLSHRSPLWDKTIRKQATCSKLSNAQLAQFRSRNLIPGFMEEEFNESTGVTASRAPSRIPLLLVQRPGSQDSKSKRLGYNSGWDVILPAGWAMPLWLAFIFRGARVGGLREAGALALEACNEPWSETFAPDTAAGHREADTRKQELTDKHFRLPPDKRPNYIKLGVTSPFYCPWSILIKEWCRVQTESNISTDTHFYVLRNRKILDELRAAVQSCPTIKNAQKKSQIPNFPNISSLLTNIDDRCLIPVTVAIDKKGTVKDFATICVPTTEDFEELMKSNLKTGSQQFQGPSEPQHEDKNEEQRKEVRNKHQKLLKTLRKNRIRNKRQLAAQDNYDNENMPSLKAVGKKRHKAVLPTKELVDAQAEKMRALWLPEVTSIKDSCSRTIVGFVCKGDFSFTEGCGMGLGYVVLPGLLRLICLRKQPLVLIRNPSSQQYRFAVLQLC